MGLKSRIEEKALDVNQQLTAQAQMKYLSWLMNEEQIDYEEALAIVQGRTDPVEWEYMLGYKLSDPALLIALFKQPRKKNRINAAKNFAMTLTDEEKIIFWRDVFDEKNAKQFKKKLKEEKKKKGIEYDPEDPDQDV
jgi:hypothetical protein